MYATAPTPGTLSELTLIYSKWTFANLFVFFFFFCLFCSTCCASWGCLKIVERFECLLNISSIFLRPKASQTECVRNVCVVCGACVVLVAELHHFKLVNYSQAFHRFLFFANNEHEICKLINPQAERATAMSCKINQRIIKDILKSILHYSQLLFACFFTIFN